MSYLVFQLYGAIASWGEIAVGETRHTASHPTKSAVVGLIAAALGIKRTEESRLEALANSFLFSCKVSTTANVLVDYQTVQVPDSKGKRIYSTRRDEIVTGRDRLSTILSSREFLTDSYCLIGLKETAAAIVSLAAVQKALNQPKFQLYLGRKAQPLAAPLAPSLFNECDGFKSALDTYTQNNAAATQLFMRNKAEYERYYWEGEYSEIGSEVNAEQIQTIDRHDQVLSRSRWQFQSRLEHCYQEAR